MRICKCGHGECPKCLKNLEFIRNNLSKLLNEEDLDIKPKNKNNGVCPHKDKPIDLKKIEELGDSLYDYLKNK